MLEKLAYWCVLLQMPIYIAQKDVIGGLHWEQTVKGLIFFFWAAVQNITPVFTGGFADKFGHKRTMLISFIIIAVGYIILATQKTFYPFLAGTVVLGIGSGIFKPALQGSVAQTIETGKSKAGWGVYFMLLNISVFFGPPLSKFLKGISWEFVFLGAAVIICLNFFVLLFVNEQNNTVQKHIESPFKILRDIFRNLFEPKLGLFVLLMSGFMIIYMQFYETLPNFIYDWTNTSGIVSTLHLPAFMTMKTARGTMISYEWLYNLNAGFVFLGVVYITWLFSKIYRTYALMIGTIISAVGLLLCGVSYYGSLTVAGFLVYTLGEMITNPRFTEHLSSIAGATQKALYMSYLNISLVIGLGGGSLLGGYIYKYFGEKAFLASEYLKFHYHINNIQPSDALNKLQTITSLDLGSTTILLWNNCHPWKIWLPFFFIGIISAAGLYFYSKKYRNQ
jgi:POT family proton-dependent oligopeptide transporter